MNIKIVGKNIEVTEALRNAVETKLAKLDKYMEESANAKVALSVEKNLQKIEVTIPLKNVILRGEEASHDMYASIDMVIDKLEGQIRKHKTKLEKQKYQGSLKYHQNDTFEDDEPEKKLVKTKRFAIKPMNVDEAILQMELLGHDFFVYFDDETSEVSVVYKRKDGNYGLIEREF